VGESHRIVDLLTSQQGVVSVLVPGVRASKKRFPGVFEMGSLVEAGLRRGRGDLPYVATARVESAPIKARGDLLRIAYLGFGVELIGALATVGQTDPKLFGLLSAWLDALEGEQPPGTAPRVALELKALSFSGWQPVLGPCAVCYEPLKEPVRFSFEAGGIVHGTCQGDGEPLEAADVLRLRELLYTSMLDHWTEPANTSCFLLTDFVEYQLGRGLHSRELLKAVEAP